MRLDGARCLVVGGARRLGRAIARDLASHGADLAVGSRSAEGAAAETCAAIRGLERRGVVVTGDAATPAGAAGLVTAAADALGGLDVLVYAAGGPFAPAAPQDEDLGDWQTSFDIAARGFFVAACAAHERFVGNADRAGEGDRAGRAVDGDRAAAPAAPAAATRGVIVALTDVLGAAPSAAFAGHGAAKAAQIALVGSLAKAWAGDGVRVCGVAPGPVDLPDDPRRAATLRAAARTARGRLVTPDEIAQAVRFVIACDSVTGANLAIDGGALL